MKTRKKIGVLAIDPGTRDIGYAFFANEGLKYFGVKSIPRDLTSKEILKEGRVIVSQLITDFRPQVLAVERTYFGNNSGSATLNQFVRNIKSLGRRQGLRVRSLPVNTVRKRVCGNGWAKKERVVKTLSKCFPQLKPYAAANREWEKDFHQNMFDAVALGVALMSISANKQLFPLSINKR